MQQFSSLSSLRTEGRPSLSQVHIVIQETTSIAASRNAWTFLATERTDHDAIIAEENVKSSDDDEADSDDDEADTEQEEPVECGVEAV